MPAPGLGLGAGTVVAGAVGVGLTWAGGVSGGRSVGVGVAVAPLVQAAMAKASAAGNTNGRRFILYPGWLAATRWLKANGRAHQLKRFIATSIFCSRRHSTASATHFTDWAIWDDSSWEKWPNTWAMESSSGRGGPIPTLILEKSCDLMVAMIERTPLWPPALPAGRIRRLPMGSSISS